MGKKALILTTVIGLAIVIAGTIFFLRSRQSSSQTEAPGNQSQELAVVSSSGETGGWQIVRHPIFHITFKLPPAWKITVFDKGRGEISGVFPGEGFDAVVNVSRQDNLTGVTSEKLLSENKNFFKVSREAIEGVGYIAQITSEAPESNINETGGIPNSHVLVNQYFVNGKILEISCSLLGPNYKTMIPTCEEIINSLQFVQ